MTNRMANQMKCIISRWATDGSSNCFNLVVMNCFIVSGSVYYKSVNLKSLVINVLLNMKDYGHATIFYVNLHVDTI
jgi:hypothetical protein